MNIAATTTPYVFMLSTSKIFSTPTTVALTFYTSNFTNISITMRTSTNTAEFIFLCLIAKKVDL